MKKALIIFNPTAGLVSRQDVRGLVEKKLKELGFDWELFLLNSEFEKNISSFDFSGLKLVVAVGGDGTIKVAARTILKNKLTCPLAVVPFGSANVIASTLAIPISIKEALKLLDKPSTKKIDVGLINGNRYFLVGFSLGYISDIVINTGKGLKNRFGMLGYFWRLFFNKIRISRLKFKIQTRNRTFWLKGNSLIIFNAFNYFGFRPKRPISISDGIFNLYVITNKTFFSLIRAGFYILLYHQPPRYVFTLDNNFFRITLRRQHFLKTAQIDGDHLNLPREIIIEVLPRALEMVVKNNG
ncbi:MAG: diacylglycerol kinase family protein [Patescibacteria group bacterium]